MEVLDQPSSELRELLDELEYEPEKVFIPNLPGDFVVVHVLGEDIPIELLACLDTANAEISGRRVWPGSAILATALSSPHVQPTILNSTILELGGGSGLAGMCAMRLGAARVVITDGDATSLDLTNQNLEANGLAGLVEARRLLWGVGEHLSAFKESEAAPVCGFDVIIAGDVLYKEDLPLLLFDTVKALLAANGQCFLCHVPRARVTHDVVRQAARMSGLSIEEFGLLEEVTLDIGDVCSDEERGLARLYILRHPNGQQDGGLSLAV